MEAGGATQRGHQTSNRERQKREEHRITERDRRFLFLRECLTNAQIARRKQWGKHGNITIFEYLFFMSHCQRNNLISVV